MVVEAFRKEINSKGYELIEAYKACFNSEGQEIDKITKYTQEQAEDIGVPFTPSTKQFKVENGMLLLEKSCYDKTYYTLYLKSYSHLEEEEGYFSLVTLDGTRHAISKKTAKQILKGNPKTK